MNKSLYKLGKFVKQKTTFLNWFYADINHFYDFISINSKGNLFIFLFNLRTILSVYSSGIKIIKKIGGTYILKGKFKNKNITWNYSIEKLCYVHCKDGFDFRMKSLKNEYFLDLIDFEEGNTIYDVGANTGDFYLCLIDLEIKNLNYFAFEPAPIAFSNLKENIKIQSNINVNIFNIGLWNVNKKLNFYLSEKSADSSLIKPIEHSSIIEIQTQKLSNIIQKPIKLLKLEAEGGEPEVLEGIGDKLRFIEYISVDLGFERGMKSDSTIPDVVNYLVKRNFECIAIERFRLICLFKNKEYDFIN